MKRSYLSAILLACAMLVVMSVSSQEIKYSDAWGNQGMTLLSQNKSSLVVNHSVESFTFDDVLIDGASMKSIHMPGVFLPNDAGEPDLPGSGRYIAIPQGSSVKVKILSSRTEVYNDVDIAPAPVIPVDTEKGPLHYEKDSKIYAKNAFYPANPVTTSEPTQIRGVDVVMLGITPFQYNPATRELVVYRDLKIEISYEGGNGQIGDTRLRSRWFDPLLKGAVLNKEIIPEVKWEAHPAANRTPDYEYLIITPNLPDFISWADSIKVWRTLQGIKTGVVTTTELGGNTVSAIENYVNTAYNTWDVPPVAVLLLGDYSTGSDGICSYLYTHPYTGVLFPGDNYFADVSGNELPDIIFSRITARNAAELEVMITKFLDYERTPPNDFNFYDRPITALGWQTVRWFQICSEVVGGYFKNAQGKNPVRINEVYEGNPTVDPWSTAPNTSTVTSYFGPGGLGYIPATPQELGNFSGGNYQDIANAINDGSFLLQHRDHGMYSGWGEPAFYTSHISLLNNVNNRLPFIFSINCQTGAYQNSTECFGERFHRYTYNGQNSGALGFIAPSEISYSFVNDTYVWGMMDNLFPDFLPDFTVPFPTDFVLPAFGQAAGKYFLFESNWPYNTSDKLVTFRLFHHHGDAFMTLYTEVPQNLSVTHAPALDASSTTFAVTADAGSSIALTVNGQIIGLANGTGSPVNITIPPQNPGQDMIVTVTKQNYYRYSSSVPVTGVIALTASFTANPTSITVGNGVNFTDASLGNPTSWQWTFEGGNPASWNGQYPPTIYYTTTGNYDVELTVGDGTDTDVLTQTNYITVNDIQYCSSYGNTALEWIAGVTVNGTSNTSGGSASGYSDFTAYSFDLNPGSSYSITLVPGFASTKFEYWRVWIDFNKDGDFSDANEEVFNASKKKSTVYGTITIPSGLDVTTRMRVSMSRSGLPGPCEILSAGEVEDYTVVIGTPAPVLPTADFSGTPTQLYTGESVQFTDQSTENPYAWSWTFTGGTPDNSAVQNPVIQYNTPGTYSVSLTVTNDAGNASITKSGYITVSDPPPPAAPVADFVGNPTVLTVGESVQFTDLSTENPTSWSWTFEGGSPATSTEQNPTVTYNVAGVYTVSLTVANTVSSDQEIKTAYITVNDAPPPSSYCEPTSINNSSNYIVSVSLGSNSYNSGQNTAGGYEYFESPVFSFSPGQSVDVNMVPNDSRTRNFWRIWIDFNNDGDFEDSDETIYINNNNKGNATGSIAIPAYASGSTRMRITMKTGNSPGPCDDYFDGEVEDYNVSFGADVATLPVQAEGLSLVLYPNPVSNVLNIHVDGRLEKTKVTLYSAQGSVVRSFFMDKNSYQLDMSGLTSGMYFVHVTDGTNKILEKVILR